MTVFSYEQKFKELRREREMRKRTYPRWVAAGRMTQAEADRQMALIEEIVAEYEATFSGALLLEQTKGRLL